jgi:hypothetical protein
MSSRAEAFEAGKAGYEAASEKIYPTPYMHAKQKEGDRSQTWIMMGDNPAGVTSAVVEGMPRANSTDVRMYKGKKNVGVYISGKDVQHIETHSEHRRKGIATAMDRLANFANGREGGKPIAHNSMRTQLGDSWAKSVGGALPEKSPSFGLKTSLLEDLR